MDPGVVTSCLAKKAGQKEREKEHMIRHQKCCYSYVMLSENRRAHEMLKILWLDIARTIKRSGELSTLVNDCFTKALYTKYHLTQILEKKKAKKDKTKRKGACSKLRNAIDQANAKRIFSFPIYNKCGKVHPEEFKSGTNLCFKCGKEGHYARKCVANQLKIRDGAWRYSKNYDYYCK